MASEDGTVPRGGIAPLVCELLVEDIAKSCAFWIDGLGFEIAYQRPEQGFVYLQRAGGAQIMLCERSGIWETGAMERPFGRGVMVQVHVEDIDLVQDRVSAAGWKLHTDRREVWRRYGDREGGRLEFAVQDPDGYLVMIAQHIGDRSSETA